VVELALPVDLHNPSKTGGAQMKTLLSIFLGGVFVVTCVAIVFARVGAFSDELYFRTENGAIDGADPVAYFTEGRMVRGDPAIALQWENAHWQFSSLENREAFRRNPTRYAPQYGGYCAFGVAEGFTFDSDPEAWSIVDDRLYLNFDKPTRALWRTNNATLVVEANRYWPAVLR
jgi:hypothetical protein